MDASSYVTGALGVLVVLAGFWAFMGTQFVRKDVLHEQNKRFDEKLDGIAAQIARLGETTIIKGTVNEVFDRLAEAFPDARLRAK